MRETLGINLVRFSISSTPFSVLLSPYCSPVLCDICGWMQQRKKISINSFMNTTNSK